VRRAADEALLTAIVTTLKATTGLTALATGGIYNNVPQDTPFPYVEVIAPTGRRQDTMGRYGAETLVDVKACSQGAGDQQGLRIRDQVIRALDMQHPTASEHTVLGIAWETNEKYDEVITGIRTRYHVATFRVWTEQSST
jgi:hypothetical protein